MAGLLVDDWIEASGGARRVLESVARVFPDADIQCLWNDVPENFPGRRVHETWMARTPLRHHKALALPAMAGVWRRLRPGRDYDWMLTTSHLFAHHAHLVGAEVPKYVYAHTPARYIWNPELDERGEKLVVRTAAPFLRRLDRRRAQEPLAIAANSAFVRARIARAWERDAVVIHPPVDVDRIRGQADWRRKVFADDELRVLDALPPQFVLGASRFIAYKHLDLVIRAAEKVGLPVVIAGNGPDESRLRAIAADVSVPVLFVVAPTDALMFALMQQASVFVFPPVEDFGIVPVEAQAAGTPVVTGPVGGQLEAITPGVSGVIADSTDVADLAAAIDATLHLSPFDADAVTAHFREERFATEIRAFVTEA